MASRLGALGGGEGLVLTESVVDGVGVGESFHQVRGELDDVGALSHAVIILAAHGLGEVELAGQERVGFDGLDIKSGV